MPQQPATPDRSASTTGQGAALWQGSPSQVLMLGSYLLAAIALGLIGWAFVERAAIASRLDAWGMGAVAAQFERIAAVLAVVALLALLLRYLVLRSTRYTVREGCIEVVQGMLNRRTDVLELYRVRDLREERPLWLRVFGLGNVVLISSDNSDPMLVLRALPNTVDLLRLLRSETNSARDRHRMVGIEESHG